MSIVDEYIKSGGGNWLRANDVTNGDIVTIEELYLDKETFDKSYICVKGKFGLTNEEVSVRLGIQNVTRIAEVLGRDESNWIGEKLKVLGTQNYPGLNSIGILWTGEKTPVEVLTKIPETSFSRTRGGLDLVNK